MVLSVTELRIGNLVTIDNEVWAEYRGKPMSVTMIDTVIQMGDKDLFPDSTGTVNLMYGDIDFGQYDEFIQPIPLTEEWFKKWGFELIKFVAPNQQCGIDLFYGYDYAIKKIGNKTDLIIRYKDGKFKLDDFYSTDLKYVHTIQNLYFALTGKELTFKG